MFANALAPLDTGAKILACTHRGEIQGDTSYVLLTAVREFSVSVCFLLRSLIILASLAELRTVEAAADAPPPDSEISCNFALRLFSFSMTSKSLDSHEMPRRPYQLLADNKADS